MLYTDGTRPFLVVTLPPLHRTFTFFAAWLNDFCSMGRFLRYAQVYCLRIQCPPRIRTCWRCRGGCLRHCEFLPCPLLTLQFVATWWIYQPVHRQTGFLQTQNMWYCSKFPGTDRDSQCGHSFLVAFTVYTIHHLMRQFWYNRYWNLRCCFRNRVFLNKVVEEWTWIFSVSKNCSHSWRTEWIQ